MTIGDWLGFHNKIYHLNSLSNMHLGFHSNKVGLYCLWHEAKDKKKTQLNGVVTLIDSTFIFAILFIPMDRILQNSILQCSIVSITVWLKIINTVLLTVTHTKVSERVWKKRNMTNVKKEKKPIARESSSYFRCCCCCFVRGVPKTYRTFVRLTFSHCCPNIFFVVLSVSFLSHFNNF